MNAPAKALDNYRIVSFTAENVKRIQAITIRPDGSMVEITGDNTHGKTSVLDAIWWTIEGAKHIQEMPIRKGAEEAVIKLDLGKLKVTRKFKAKEGGAFTTSITIATEEGAKFDSPQKMLDTLIGALSMDPVAFMRMAAPEQLNALRKFVPDVDFDGLDKLNETDKTARTDVNRDIKNQKTLLSAVVIPEDTPAQRVDETALIAELESAGNHNTDIEKRRANREDALRNIATERAEATSRLHRAEELIARADELRKQADTLVAEAADIAKGADALQAKLDEAEVLPAPMDTADIRQKIEAARIDNAKFDAGERARAEGERLAASVTTLEAKSLALTNAIDARNKEKADAVLAAKMPIDGISFGDGVVLFNGVPFNQASDAEQLLASVAIAAAQNPRLRVIRIRDGSLIGKKLWAVLEQWAVDNDFQLWVETVESNRPTAIVIEDGMVKGATQQAAE